MTRILKIAAIAAAALIILMIIRGTPEDETTSDGRRIIRYWFITGAQEEIPYHARKFNAIQESVYVVSTAIPWQEHEKKILTGILSGNPPDLILQVTPVVKWASRMALVPLDEYIHRDGFDTTIFFHALWDEMKWNGSVFALPVNSASYAFLYNKRLFRDAGLDPENPPRTWEEVRAYNRALTERDARGRIVRMGYIPTYGNLQTSMVMAWQLGARFLGDGGRKVTMSGDGTVSAIEEIVDFFFEYPVGDVQAFVAGFGPAEQHGFLSEKVAMMILDSSFLDQIERYKPGLEFGVAPVPSFPGYPTASSSGSWWLAIPRGAKNPDAAWELMKLAVSTETQLESVFEMQENLFPGSRVAAYDPVFMKDEMTGAFVRQMDYAHSPAIVPMAHDVFWREFMGAQERAIHRLQSPAEALAQAERVVQHALNESLAYDTFVRGRMSPPEVQ